MIIPALLTAFTVGFLVGRVYEAYTWVKPLIASRIALEKAKAEFK